MHLDATGLLPLICESILRGIVVPASTEFGRAFAN